MANRNRKNELRLKRKKRIRVKISGTASRPRLSVFKSAKHMYAQVIDDERGLTLASVQSFADKVNRCGVESSTVLGQALASKCLEKNISSVLFDKNGYAYHGRVKAFADGARAGGLKF